MTLFVSLVVIIGVAAIVGRICARSRPGDHRSSADGTSPDGIALPDTGHHSGWAHTHSHAHSHDAGGWGGDSGGGGDSSGGGGGD